MQLYESQMIIDGVTSSYRKFVRASDNEGTVTFEVASIITHHYHREGNSNYH